MAAPTQNHEFLEVVLKSGVLDEARLNKFIEKLHNEPSGLPKAPSELSGRMVAEGLLTYFQADQLLQGKWKRFSIGKYRVLERIGVGGMGQVFLCEHKLMKRRVAVKVLPAAKAREDSSLQRFYREARAVAAVDHPNIVRAYDIDQDEGLHFLVMEFVDGTNLHDIVRKFGPMDITRACHYMYASAVGLHHANEMGLIHRDIKPANILVDRSGIVKILDLGLARFFEPEEEDLLTKKFDENVLGTADYLAPEQAVDSHEVDIRADIYGLGGTFYYLLTGRAPFADGTVAQKLLWHQTMEPPPIQQFRPDTPPELLKIVQKMMQKEPDDRYQTPTELMNALFPWVQSPIAPPPEQEMPQLSPAAMQGVNTRSIQNQVLLTTPPPRGIQTPQPTSGVQEKFQPLTPTRSSTAVSPPASSGHLAGLPPIAMMPTISANSTHGSSSQARAGLPVAKPISPGWIENAEDTLRNLAGETEEKINSANKLTPARRSQVYGGRAKQAKQSSKLIWMIAGVSVIVLAVVAVVIVLKPWEKSPSVSTNTGSRKIDEWYVSASDNSQPDATKRTLQAALNAAKPGDTIFILDDEFESPPIRVPKQLRDVKIVSKSPSQISTWICKPSSSTNLKAALELNDIGGFQMTGIHLDLQGRIETGIYLTGSCEGSRFQDMTIKNASISGVQTLKLFASSSKPLVFQNVRIISNSNARSAIHLQSQAGFPTFDVHVQNCQLEGDAKTGIWIEGPAKGILIQENRFFQLQNGLLINGDRKDTDSVGVKVENNTFYQIRANAFQLESALAGGREELKASRNLFANCKSVITAKDPKQTQGVVFESNVHDAKTQVGNLTVPCDLWEDLVFLETKPDQAAFLRLPEDHPLKSYPPKNVRIGAE